MRTGRHRRTGHERMSAGERGPEELDLLQQDEQIVSIERREKRRTETLQRAVGDRLATRVDI